MSPLNLPTVENDAAKIQLERITHVYFEHPDLDSFSQFALDFGLEETWRDADTILFRGYGRDPYCYVARRAATGAGPQFGGGAFLAQSESEFQKAVALPGAVLVDLSSYPGGGKQVTITSPSGFPIHVTWGQEERVGAQSPPSAVVETLGPANGSVDKRRFGKFQRFHEGPALVHKLGHYGCIVARWDEEIRWYTGTFNFVPSDVQWMPGNPDVDVIAFMHLDLGERFSDHHTLFLARAQPGERDRMHHTSYEVDDFDTQLLGHQYLARKGYHSVWGVGRHILGSQIFDYWRDPTGFVIEHYADGDLVNAATGTKRSEAGPLAVWGPEMPKDMSEDATRPTPA